MAVGSANTPPTFPTRNRPASSNSHRLQERTGTAPFKKYILDGLLMQNFRSVYVEERIDNGAKSDTLAHSLNSHGILSGNQPKPASG